MVGSPRPKRADQRQMCKSGWLKVLEPGLGLVGDKHDPWKLSAWRGEIPDQGTQSEARNCHCSMCRKAQGAAFRSRASLNVSDLEWVQGENLITFYESSPGNHRGFCRVCGSPIVSKFGGASHYGLALGTLDDDPGVQPQLHVHVASKAPWFTITDDLPQFPVGPKW